MQRAIPPRANKPNGGKHYETNKHNRGNPQQCKQAGGQILSHDGMDRDLAER